MRTEADKICIKELGLSLHEEIKIICRNISRKLISQVNIQLPYKNLVNDYGTQITCTNLTNIENKRPFIATGFVSLGNGQIWDWEVTRKDSTTHFTSFTKRSTNAPASNSSKTCTCNWSFLHSNNGCKCGAITPYQPKNFYK